METRSGRLDRLPLHEVHEVLRSWGVRHAYLFGSMARGKAGAGSDADVALVMPEPWDLRWGLRHVSIIAKQLTPLFGRPVDVVFLNDASPLLLFEAALQGIPLMTEDADERFDFERRARAAYEDYAHLQSYFTRALRERLGLAP